MNQTPYATAMQRIVEATAKSRDNASPLDDNYQSYRYRVLKSNPEMMRTFVSQAIGSRNPDDIEAGVQDYISQMEAKNAVSGKRV